MTVTVVNNILNNSSMKNKEQKNICQISTTKFFIGEKILQCIKDKKDFEKKMLENLFK